MRIKLCPLFFSMIILSNCTDNNTSLKKPPHLKSGDTIALVAPAFQFEQEKLPKVTKRFESWGLKPVYEDSIMHQFGYFSGTDEERSAAINKAIHDDKVKAIIAVKGGYGSANLLDKIDYEYLKKHPKIILGRSDVTALLIAVYTKSNIVTFYGPGAAAKQSAITRELLKNMLFDNETNKILDNHEFNKPGVHDEFTTHTITPGITQGKFVGGNLSVLVSLLGTPYFPKDWKGTILFVEDINEDIYKIDRMLGQLRNAGVLNQISGFVFGTCKDCKSEAVGGFSLEDVLDRYIKPLNIPAYSGAAIGHQKDTYTVPIGSMVVLDANKKQIKLIENP